MLAAIAQHAEPPAEANLRRERCVRPAAFCASAVLIAALLARTLTLHGAVMALSASATFAVIEFIFCALTAELNDAERRWCARSAPLLRRVLLALHPWRIARTGHTTWEQFALNVAVFPLARAHYDYFTGAVAMRVATFPVLVYTVELVGGTFLTHVWGRRAWYYERRKHTVGGVCFALADGNITLLFLPAWLLLGVVHELLWNAQHVRMADAVAPLVAGHWLPLVAVLGAPVVHTALLGVLRAAAAPIATDLIRNV